MGVWHAEGGYTVVKVCKGILKPDHVGVVPEHANLHGQTFLVALQPSDESQRLLQDEHTRFTHLTALVPSEILAAERQP